MQSKQMEGVTHKDRHVNGSANSTESATHTQILFFFFQLIPLLSVLLNTYIYMYVCMFASKCLYIYIYVYMRQYS